MNIQHFFDPDTNTLSYIVHDPKTLDAVIIDPVWNLDLASGSLSSRTVNELAEYIEKKQLKVKAILETHAHADHLSGSQLLKKLYPGAPLAIGKDITIVQETFKRILNRLDVESNGSQFDRLIQPFEEVSFGSITLKAIPTPGHTPACMSYLIDDAVFTGDALFMPDYGTGRCDFPQGSAKDLYHSVHENLYSLPDSTRVFVGHDYAPGGRDIQWETTIGESKQKNIQLKKETSEKEYIEFREARDKTLSAPKLLFPSLQINISAGHLPPEEENGKSFLKIPLKVNK